jgi:hypothetical protein
VAMPDDQTANAASAAQPRFLETKAWLVRHPLHPV